MKPLALCRWIAPVLVISGGWLWLAAPRGASGKSPVPSQPVAPPSVISAVPAPSAKSSPSSGRELAPPGIWDRLENPVVLDTAERRQADGTVRRARLLRVTGKYPLVVFEGTLPPEGSPAEDGSLADATARVADHLMVSPAEGVSDEEFRRAVTDAGLATGERLAPGGPYLVKLPTATIAAAGEAIRLLEGGGRVAYAEPDYLVHAADIPGADRLVDVVDGVAMDPEAALDAATMLRPDSPVFDAEVQEAATEQRLLDFPVGTRILTFDKPTFLGGTGSYNPYLEEQNFLVSTSTGVVIQTADSAGFPNNGTNFARSLSSETNFTVRHREGLPFNMVAVDLSEYSTVFPTPHTVSFTGHKAGGGTVTQSFTTDGVIDGIGLIADFETFTFNSHFTDLTKVVANSTRFMVDNIAVVVEGQETPPPAPPELPLLYDVTWEAPIHAVNQLTAVGGGYAPTSINFGTPTVRSQVGSMVGPALEFKGAGYQQLRYNLRQNARAYRLEFDAYIDLPTDFLIYFDGAGGAQNLQFRSNGTIGAFQSFITTPSTLGTYPPRQVTRIAVNVDMIAGEWEIFVGGVSKFVGPFGISNGDMSSIRFHEDGSATGSAGVDNLRIYAYDPGSTLTPGPRIAVSPASLAFPSLTLGSSQTWAVAIRNTGGQSLNVQSVVPSNSQFRVNWPSPVSILPGGTLSLPVEFRPEQIGAISGSLAIASDDATRPLLSVPLTGTGVGIPSITLTPPGLDVTMLAKTTGLQNFTLGNDGVGSLSWTLFLKPAATQPGEPTDPSVSPGDPLYESLWAMRQPQAASGGIDATHAWSLTTGSASNIIAVIDTGVDRTHPELQGNLWVNPGETPGNGIDDDGNGYIDDVNGWDFRYGDNDPSDVHGHGTHVSGTIAARGDNALGVAGVCWNARILPLKFLSDTGSGYTSDAVSAVRYATQAGARISNNSWGGGGFSQALHDAIQAAGQAGSLFVAAAGNSSADSDAKPQYPAGYNLGNIVSVAASDEADGLSYFSNYGRASVDLAAPGSNILSLRPGGQYKSSSGTSMATPHVVGVAALLLSRNPALNPTQIKQLLIFGSDSLAALGHRVASGGRLNAYRTLKSSVPEWLRLQILSGTVAAGQSMQVPVAIDTASLEPGIYPLAIGISSNDPARPIVDLPVMLRVIEANGYHQWLATHFASGGMIANPAESALWGDSADPDGDRLGNLIEFITASEPIVAGAGNPATMVLQDGEEHFEFRVRDALVGVSYRVEWTTDPGAPSWRTDGVVTVVDTTDGMPPGTRRLRVKLTDPTLPAAFFRIAGSRNP